MQTLSEEQALQRMSAYCAAAEHCRAEVENKLRNCDIDEAAIARIVERLYAAQFLDDERYCRNFVSDKVRFAAWGRYKIRMALRAKELPETAIDRALDELDETVYTEQLHRLIAKKQATLNGANAYETRAKLFRFATARGFLYEEIARVID
jgi:regulatory protein